MGRDKVPGFAEAVRAARLAAGHSIDTLAEASGVHRDSIAKLEREQRSPSLRIAATLAAALGVTVDQLLVDAGNQPAKANGKGSKTQKRKGIC
jgi:transcriptional regulator with XRE-family HTH domain